MKIKFLGTSSGWPLPRLGCRCKICTSPDPKDKRTRSSVLINDFLLIDCGPNFYDQFQHQDPTKISDVFITHAHPDHVSGLWDLKIYHKEKNLKLYISKVTHKKILNLIHFAAPKIIFIKPDQKIKISNLNIIPFLVDHTSTTETLGFKIFEKKSFVYIPDFRTIPRQSIKYCRRANILVLDGSSISPAGPKKWGHLPIKKSILLAKHFGAHQVYFTHIGHGPKSGTHQELEDFVQKKGGKTFHVAYDDLELVA